MKLTTNNKKMTYYLKGKRVTAKVFYLKESDGRIFAYFPVLTEDKQGNKLAFDGAHTLCHPDYAAECELATHSEWKFLHDKLKAMGYDITILNDSLEVYYLRAEKSPYSKPETAQKVSINLQQVLKPDGSIKNWTIHKPTGQKAFRTI